MDVSYVSDEIKKQLEKIDFNARRWVKSKIHCNKLVGVTRQDAIETIFDVKMKILKVFMKHKQEIHESADPEGLCEISKAFDFRWWNLEMMNNANLALEDKINHFSICEETFARRKALYSRRRY